MNRPIILVSSNSEELDKSMWLLHKSILLSFILRDVKNLLNIFGYNHIAVSKNINEFIDQFARLRIILVNRVRLNQFETRVTLFNHCKDEQIG